MPVICFPQACDDVGECVGSYAAAQIHSPFVDVSKSATSAGVRVVQGASGRSWISHRAAIWGRALRGLVGLAEFGRCHGHGPS